MFDIIGEIIGSAIQADAVGDASDAQQAGLSADRQLKDKWLTTQWNAGAGARTLQNSVIQELMTRLGLAGTTAGSGPAVEANSATPQTYDSLRASLLGNYTSGSRYGAVDSGDGQQTQFIPGVTDEAGLEAAINARLATQAAQQQAGAPSQLAGDPSSANYGSLMRAFTGADLQNEPGYQFGLNQGNKLLQGSAAARGGLYSGANLKALNKFGQDYGGTKFGEAFNRDAANKDRMFGYLSGAGGFGSGIATQANNNSLSLVNSLGSNAIQGGNLQAQAGLARGSVWGNLATNLGSRNWGGGGNAYEDGLGGVKWYDGGN